MVTLCTDRGPGDGLLACRNLSSIKQGVPMRPWARWTARMALAAVVSAAAGGGLSGMAFAGTGGSPAGTSQPGGSGLLGSLGVPYDVCGDASALLGVAVVGCRNGTAAAFAATRGAGAAGGSGRSASGRGADRASAATAGASPRGTKTGDRGTSPASTVFSGAAASGPNSSALRQTFGDTLNAPGLGAGTTSNPAAAQQAGLSTLPGPADLPSLNGPTSVSAGRGTPGGSTLMPGSALSAADVAGMSSDSFAALAIGALLAGAAALKIASRRVRDGKAGIGATI